MRKREHEGREVDRPKERNSPQSLIHEKCEGDRHGVAVEDLAAADLNVDGRIDIVAVGRQTHNIRIYWNEGTH